MNNYSFSSTRNLTDRQIRIWGEENQEKIHKSKVLVLGSDYISEMVLAGLVGLGVGNILIMGNDDPPKEKPSFLSPKRNLLSKMRSFPETLNKINPFTNIKSVHSCFSKSLLNYYNFNPQVIIDTTNNSESKLRIIDYLKKRKDKTFISSYGDSTSSGVYRWNFNKPNPHLVRKGIDKSSLQGIVPSGIAAGIVLEEVRKSLISLEGDKKLNEEVRYNLNLKDRTSSGRIDIPISKLESEKCLIAGAGGIGTYAALNLALSGFKKIDILDYDEVNETNLNRQILFYDKLGEKKAKVLNERIKKIVSLKSRDFSDEKYKIDSESFDFLRKQNYSLILGCFDNVRARYLLNHFAVDLKVPYIDGGTSTSKGSVLSYFPGETSCVSCKKNLSLEEEVRHSCDYADPSVVMPNMVVGSLMIGEAINIVSNRDKRGYTIAYDNNHPKRIYQKPSPKKKGGCRC